MSFDGAARNNGSAAVSATAGYGFVATGPSGEVVSHYAFIGEATNNVAEFTAFAAACHWLAVAVTSSGAPPSAASLVGDSELVVEAFHRRRIMKARPLRKLMAMARGWLAMACPVRVTYVPRSRNAAADAVANMAIDTRGSTWELSDPLAWASPPCAPPGGWARYGDGHGTESPSLPERLSGPPPP